MSTYKEIGESYGFSLIDYGLSMYTNKLGELSRYHRKPCMLRFRENYYGDYHQLSISYYNKENSEYYKSTDNIKTELVETLYDGPVKDEDHFREIIRSTLFPNLTSHT